MAIDLNADVGGLILAKHAVVLALESENKTNQNYGEHIMLMQQKLSTLRNTLYKYRELISAAGVNTQRLNYELEIEFMTKAQKLKDLKQMIGQPNMQEEDLREDIIIYLKTCINILKNAKGILEKFKP
jgi:hypothetical protein